MVKVNPNPQPGEGTIWFDYFLATDPRIQSSSTARAKNIGAIVGGTLGGVVFLIFIVIAFVFLRRRNKRQLKDIEPWTDKEVQSSRKALVSVPILTLKSWFLTLKLMVFRVIRLLNPFHFEQKIIRSLMLFQPQRQPQLRHGKWRYKVNLLVINRHCRLHLDPHFRHLQPVLQTTSPAGNFQVVMFRHQEILRCCRFPVPYQNLPSSMLIAGYVSQISIQPKHTVLQWNYHLSTALYEPFLFKRPSSGSLLSFRWT